MTEKIWAKWYDKGVPVEHDFPQIPLREMFRRNVEDRPHRPYIVFRDMSFTYHDSNVMICQLADSMFKLGIKKGDRVALMMPNIPQYVFSLLACFKTGFIAVPTNPLYVVDELKEQFNDSQTETVIVLAMFADKVVNLLKDTESSVKRIIVVQSAAAPVEIEEHEAIYDFNQLVMSGSNVEPDIEILPSDYAMLQYTGGTTGKAKGCVLTNANILAMSYQLNTEICGLIPMNDLKALGVIPLFHIFGFNTSINTCLYTGGTMVLEAQPSVENILEDIVKYQPTLWTAVPALIIGIINHPETPNYDLRSLKGIMCGSSPVPVEAILKFEELTGAVIFEGYGLSESTNILTANMVFKRKIGSVGIPLSNTDLKVVDIENGIDEMPLNEPGEIIARGPQIMPEYWNNPEETANALRDGWLYTGDIGYMDEDGFVFIVDRKKDMIICSGFNVYPRDIDEVLYTHPAVMDACTIGVKDEKRGEAPKSYIVLKAGKTTNADEIMAYCREKLAAYKVPQYIEFIEDLPRTMVGKPDRKELKILAATEKS
ncbi:MAG: long-chain fatty acid--CoA ligase [Syntrophomonadaceae bacterium]|nr:long-chain fatty acid--CoA ligase [Syntrophomonadaceae bacterium]